MSQQVTLEDLLNATSSQGSGSGPTPCVEPIADGIAGDLGLVRLESYPDHPHKERIIYAPLIQKGKARVGRLRGYGNAIVCPVATEFIRAYMEVLHD